MKYEVREDGKIITVRVYPFLLPDAWPHVTQATTKWVQLVTSPRGWISFVFSDMSREQAIGFAAMAFRDSVELHENADDLFRAAEKCARMGDNEAAGIYMAAFANCVE